MLSTDTHTNGDQISAPTEAADVNIYILTDVLLGCVASRPVTG